MSAPYNLSRKEGWRQWVDTPPYARPDLLTLRQLASLSPAAKAEYDRSRAKWHANFGILRTPQLVAIHEELDLIVSANQQDADRVKGAVVLDALPGLGKTTIANAFARDLDRAERERLGELTSDGHERLPVFHVGLSSNTTLRTLNQMICDFYAHPEVKGQSRAAEHEMLGGPLPSTWRRCAPDACPNRAESTRNPSPDASTVGEENDNSMRHGADTNLRHGNESQFRCVWNDKSLENLQRARPRGRAPGFRRGRPRRPLSRPGCGRGRRAWRRRCSDGS